MNYEKIYNSLIQKRRLQKIDRTNKTPYVEYHHIIPVSCGGDNNPRKAKYNSSEYNLIGLTTKEHFFAHLLLRKFYKEKYGIDSKFYQYMLKAIDMMLGCKKYNIRISSRLYQTIKNEAYIKGIHKTTTGRMWVTNGKEDILLKPNEQIPIGFKRGRTINFTEEQRQQYSNKISIATKGRKPWNSGKHGIYSVEYRKKISDSHADVSGKNNGRYGSRAMINLKTGDKKIVSKDKIAEFIENGYIIKRTLKNKSIQASQW